MILAFVVTLSAVVVAVILGALIPLAVGLITKLNASEKLRGGLLLVLSAISGLIVANTAGDGSAVLDGEAIAAAVVSLATALGTYYGIYKPNNTNAKLAPRFGLGSSIPKFESGAARGPDT